MILVPVGPYRESLKAPVAGLAGNYDPQYRYIYVRAYRGRVFICASQSQFLFHPGPLPRGFCLVRGCLCGCSSLENLLFASTPKDKRP